MSNPTICAVLVLYRTRLQDSPTYVSWEQAMQDGDLNRHFRLLVYDNTPDEVAVPPPTFQGRYLHQPSNPGLAVSYSLALADAAEAGDQWLLLLDQDTVLTRVYLQEVLSVTEAFAMDVTVAAAVPKLMENGIVQSPHAALTTLHPPPLSPDVHGFASEGLQMYNSGAVIRVSSLQTIGGFPSEFWLDFLDHATFYLLRQEGRILVMQSSLQHQLSTNAKMQAWNRTYLRRHNNVLCAESLYYRRYGTPRERRWYRLRLLRRLYGALKHVRLPMAWQLLRALAGST